MHVHTIWWPVFVYPSHPKACRVKKLQCRSQTTFGSKVHSKLEATLSHTNHSECYCSDKSNAALTLQIEKGIIIYGTWLQNNGTAVYNPFWFFLNFRQNTSITWTENEIGNNVFYSNKLSSLYEEKYKFQMAVETYQIQNIAYYSELSRHGMFYSALMSTRWLISWSMESCMWSIHGFSTCNNMNLYGKLTRMAHVCELIIAYDHYFVSVFNRKKIWESVASFFTHLDVYYNHWQGVLLKHR